MANKLKPVLDYMAERRESLDTALAKGEHSYGPGVVIKTDEVAEAITAAEAYRAATDERMACKDGLVAVLFSRGTRRRLQAARIAVSDATSELEKYTEIVFVGNHELYLHDIDFPDPEMQHGSEDIETWQIAANVLAGRFDVVAAQKS